ncbi:MAG: hypothetical protein JXR37_09960 [Kiritimatiellae bacterium]|nr:hypothetical protein [Kiritimatiellia bacterium]
MKKSPQLQKLEETMRGSALAARGFLGNDRRSLPEIIETDLHALARLGYTKEHLASRMQELTDLGRQGLGTAVRVEEHVEVTVDEHRGQIVCPWPHAGRFAKTVTTVRRLDTGEEMRWAELSIHLVAVHGFFQGRGSPFRLDPQRLVRVLF